jgi:two-component system cell cycle response regulator DivK
VRILYVEDNPANLFLVKRVARMGSHEVLNYIDGEEALKNFAQDKPDLVLMDIQLAGELSGLEVVKKLREDGHTVPIIAVTAYAMLGDRERCLKAGCDDYLAKPLPVPQLVDLFERYTPATPPSQPVTAADYQTEQDMSPILLETVKPPTPEKPTVTTETSPSPTPAVAKAEDGKVATPAPSSEEAPQKPEKVEDGKAAAPADNEMSQKPDTQSKSDDKLRNGVP